MNKISLINVAVPFCDAKTSLIVFRNTSVDWDKHLAICFSALLTRCIEQSPSKITIELLSDISLITFPNKLFVFIACAHESLMIIEIFEIWFLLQTTADSFIRPSLSPNKARLNPYTTLNKPTSHTDKSSFTYFFSSQDGPVHKILPHPSIKL